MNLLLILGIIFITLALGFYSFGVIESVKRKILRLSDIAFFGIGLLFDLMGTITMSVMARTGSHYLSPVAGNLMAISGTAAILLMGFHIILALLSIYKFPKLQKNFWKLSLGIYLFWLISYVLGPIGLFIK